MGSGGLLTGGDRASRRTLLVTSSFAEAARGLVAAPTSCLPVHEPPRVCWRLCAIQGNQ